MKILYHNLKNIVRAGNSLRHPLLILDIFQQNDNLKVKKKQHISAHDA